MYLSYETIILLIGFVLFDTLRYAITITLLTFLLRRKENEKENWKSIWS